MNAKIIIHDDSSYFHNIIAVNSIKLYLILILI